MLNYWWVTRPKRKLNSIPDVLACCASVSLNSEWQGNVFTHLAFEEALEESGLKRVGERRDQRGGGGRTYFAWLFSLGLVFTHEATGQTKLTLAGEAILNGSSPARIIQNQVMKYQFPSPFSLSPNSSKSRVNSRFRIRPFRFLLRLLLDERLKYYLTQEEIAKIVVTEADQENDSRYNYIVQRIIQFRNFGDEILETDFFSRYAPSSGKVNELHPFSHLLDLANTLINWLEYTQLIGRISENGSHIIEILPEKIADVKEISRDESGLIDRPDEQEYFQRKFGLDPNHQKDTRNFSNTQTITARIVNTQIIQQAFIAQALREPIYQISNELVSKLSENLGIDYHTVEETLLEKYPIGAISAFMTEYFAMAFRGRDDALEFEKATVEIFLKVFKYEAQHVGPIGLTPDVLIVSREQGYQAIIDNKAYSRYSLTNDHYNRMVHNYLKQIGSYGSKLLPVAFFSYIAGGFNRSIDAQIKRIYQETGVKGSAVSVSHIIKLVEEQQISPKTHEELHEFFSANRIIGLNDI